MIVESKPNVTTMTGVSRAVPDRKSDLGAGWEDTERRSESLFKKAVSDSTIGACLVIQERYAVMSAWEAGPRDLISLL